MTFDPVTVLVTLLAVFVIAFAKGAFGGGLATLGIPLLALVMDPLTGGALLAPLFLVMDLVALRYWSPKNWSKPDLAILTPCMIVGIGIGTLLLFVMDGRSMAIAIGAITLVFSAQWFLGGGKMTRRPRSTWGAALAGTGSGVTTMVAHAGGPPLALYLLPLGLPKSVYAGTTSIFFTVGNFVKVIPWLWVTTVPTDVWWLALLAVPTIPLGVWVGWRLHEGLDQRALYRVCYGLLVVTGIKLLWDGISGYLA